MAKLGCRTPLLTVVMTRYWHRGVGLPQDRWGGGRYPVASASLSRSRPGVGGPAGAPNALNELDPLPQACYASGVDVTGYPRTGNPPLLAPGKAIPEPRAAGGTCIRLRAWEPHYDALVQAVICGEP